MTAESSVRIGAGVPGDAEFQAWVRAGEALYERSVADLVGVRAPDPARVETYRQRLEELAKLRAGELYYPYLSTGRGNGPWVELADGSVKLDFITGIGVHGYGHGSSVMREAGFRAALCDTVMQGNLQQLDASVDLCRRFVEMARRGGGEIEHVTLCTSGAMANENALKLAYHARPGRTRILAFDRCFAGRTLVLSQLTDKPAFRVGLPETVPVDYLPFFDANDRAGSTARALTAMRRVTGRYPKGHAAFWIELVQGEGGYNVGDREFFVTLCEEARRQEIPIVFDEVQTFGRTTAPFAFQHFGLESFADIVTVGKVTQACATLCTGRFRPGPGLISQTFTVGTWELLAADAVLRGLDAGGHFGIEGRNAAIQRRFAQGLEAISRRQGGALRGPWGIGAMIAATPLDGTVDQAKRLAQLCFEEGLMGFVAGSDPTRIRFLPPLLVVTDEQIDVGLELLERAVVRLREE